MIDIRNYKNEEDYKPIDFSQKKNTSFSVKHIYIRKDQILFDVDAQTGLVMRSRRERGIDNNTIGTDQSDDFLPLYDRWVEKYTDYVKMILSAYIKSEPRIASINTLKKWEEMDIELEMPKYWNGEVYPMLVTAIHDYIVNGVLYDYFTLTLTANDPVTQAKKMELDEGEGRIKQLLCNVKQVRKPLQPF